MNKKCLWILSEERPKSEVIKVLVELYSAKFHKRLQCKEVKILPVIAANSFEFIYCIKGIEIDNIAGIFLKLVSGNSSFVDFLIYESGITKPELTEAPLLLAEETKTTDKESRNTGVFQRASKFVYVDMIYPNVEKVMIYNLKVEEQVNLTDTNVFGTKCLKTIGVTIVGKQNLASVQPFTSIDELISEKNRMRPPPRGNVPITITKRQNELLVSGRLFKSGNLSHDPNIGALTLISKAARNLNWDKRIIIINHGLSQKHLNPNNKFVIIANNLTLELDGLRLPIATIPTSYWYYEHNSEKIVGILLHVLALNSDSLIPIYENHAGCERGYFYDIHGAPHTIPKYINEDKSLGIIPLADLIIRDDLNKEIILIEAKISSKLNEAIRDINDYSPLEQYVLPFYKGYTFKRTVVLYGDYVENENIAFILNNDGKLHFPNSHRFSFIEKIKEAISLLSK